VPEPFPLAPSLWARTACAAPPTPPLDGSTRADVCIVGGGYAGLSTALHLAERGARVIVLEAYEPGWGGSGRNGGQVIAGIKYDPEDLLAKFGPEVAERMIRFVGGTADVVFDLIQRHRMDVPFVRNGWIQGAHTEAGIDLVRERARQWSARGVVGARFLVRDEVASLLGNDKYLGGWLDPRGGGLQPLSYSRELARVAIAAGAQVCGRSDVIALTRRGPGWTVATAHGPQVDAEKVVVCTNGYTGDLWPGLKQSIIAPNSYQVATEPLPADVAAQILPQGHVSSDTRQLLFYFRLDHQNRLLMGGRGPFREPQSNDDWSHLERVLGRMFPVAASAKIEFRWCGRVALTRDFLPHLHEPAPGLLIDIGCMGRGIGLQSAMGKALAEYLHSGDRRALPFPPVEVKPLPLHGLRKAYISAIVAWYRMNDGGLAS
jgi:glycine/D-amino acid oxidase-like deaminating enzyme